MAAIFEQTTAGRAESGVIGCVLIDNATLSIVRSSLKRDDFYSERNRLIIDAMCDLEDAGSPVNLITLQHRLSDKPYFTDGSGIVYLMDCETMAISAMSIDHNVSIVRSEAIRRRLAQFGEHLKAVADKDGIQDIDATVATLSEQLSQLSDGGVKAPWENLGDIVSGIIHDISTGEKGDAVKSGFSDLDAKIQGFRPGTLTIIAARPAMGKTAFASNIMLHAAIDQGLPAAFFSLEMSKKEIGYRNIGTRAMVNNTCLQAGTLTSEQWDRVIAAAADYNRATIIVDDTSGLDIAVLKERAKRLHRLHHIQLLVVDYLQFVRNRAKSKQNREQEVADISRTLKEISKELQIPVIALSQLNRGLEARADKRPVMSDLRESGGIEQDADLVMFIHRDDYFRPNEPANNVAEIIIAKNRNGPTGVVKLHWDGEFTRFSNLANEYF